MEELYNSIFRRKSIRKYDVSPLPPDTLSEIKQYASNVKPLVPTIKTDFSYLTAENVKNPLPVKAPHYICIYSEKVEHYLMNVGFMLQQVDLYLSAKSIGSCWLGMAKPANGALLKMNGMDFVIMLAFGNAAEPLHRASISEFKRKAQNEIGALSEVFDIQDAVRLAPSATNSQPWFLTGSAERIQIHRVKLGTVKAIIYDKLNQIDIGIALCHLYIAAMEKGKNVEFLYDKNDEDKAPKGYEYMMTAVLY